MEASSLPQEKRRSISNADEWQFNDPSDKLHSELAKANDKKLLRRIDYHLLPWICLLYSLNQIDRFFSCIAEVNRRVNISTARVAGMANDLKMKDNSYSIVLLVFFPGYIVFEFISNLVIRQVGVRHWLAFIMICWGVVTTSMAFVPTWQVLAGLRVLLGVFEAGFFPGCVYLISCWYKRYEVQTRISFFFMSSVLAAGFSGILGYGLSRIHAGGLAGWRWIYLIEGSVTIFCAIVAWFFLVDFPQKARFLSQDERAWTIQRLNDDRGDGDHDGLTVAKIFRHLSDWKVWGFGLLFFGTTMPHYSLAFFVPVILNGLGFSVATSLVLTAPPYVLAILVALTTSYWADKSRHRTPFLFVHSLIAIVGLAMVAAPVRNGVKVIGIFLAVAGSIPNQPTALAFAQNNVVSTSKRAVVSAVQIAFGSIGGIAASTVYRQQDYPRYLPGLFATMGCLVWAVSIAGCMSAYFHRINKKADRDEIVIEGQKGFRYTT